MATTNQPGGWDPQYSFNDPVNSDTFRVGWIHGFTYAAAPPQAWYSSDDPPNPKTISSSDLGGRAFEAPPPQAYSPFPWAAQPSEPFVDYSDMLKDVLRITTYDETTSVNYEYGPVAATHDFLCRLEGDLARLCYAEKRCGLGQVGEWFSVILCQNQDTEALKALEDYLGLLDVVGLLPDFSVTRPVRLGFNKAVYGGLTITVLYIDQTEDGESDVRLFQHTFQPPVVFDWSLDFVDTYLADSLLYHSVEHLYKLLRRSSASQNDSEA